MLGHMAPRAQKWVIKRHPRGGRCGRACVPNRAVGGRGGGSAGERGGAGVRCTCCLVRRWSLPKADGLHWPYKPQDDDGRCMAGGGGYDLMKVSEVKGQGDPSVTHPVQHRHSPPPRATGWRPLNGT